MLINRKAGNLQSFDVGKRSIDHLAIDWFEANKRIMHKATQSGKQVTIKFMQENPDLKQGDILFADDTSIIVVEINPCKTIVIEPRTILESASVCYEIGNKHLPLFHDGDELLIPYEAPLYRLLQASGYTMKIEERRLDKPIKTSVSPHAHSGSSTSLFNKILQLTTSS
jgi:urease accessory protein